jgi:pre-mRNA-splicing factor SYF1
MCPAQISHTHARRTFDRALRTLPPSLHHRIWPRYLLWSEAKGGSTTVHVYRRYLAIDPSITERYTSILLSPDNPERRPLEAAKLLLGLARKAAQGKYTSPEGKSPYQLLGEWVDTVEQYAEEVGMDTEECEKNTAENKDADEAEAKAGEMAPPPVPTGGGPLMRMGTVTSRAQGQEPYDKDTDPTSTRKLNIERIIRRDGLEVYKDQAGRLWTGLATYWTKRGEFERAKATFEAGIANVLTIRDFTQIFDAYAEFQESFISALMASLEDPSEDDDDVAETERELDVQIKSFEGLMDRRPFLVNDVLLRRNPHDVQEWEKRVALWGDDDEKVAATYTKSLETINPKKATTNFYRIYVNFAKFYEEGGVTGQAEPDLASAWKIFEKGAKVNFKTVEELAELYCEWAEMELRHECVCLLCDLKPLFDIYIGIMTRRSVLCNARRMCPKIPRSVITIILYQFKLDSSSR